MSIKNAKTKATCRCCSVHFDATICAQCQTAGCAGNKKGQKCRLSDPIQEAMAMTPHQLQMAYAGLKKNYSDLLVESQRLARIVHEYESKSGAGIPVAVVPPEARVQA